MKIGAALALMLVIGASGQTFQSYRFTTPQTNVFTVPAGTLCELVSAQVSWNAAGGGALGPNCWVIYPEATNHFVVWWYQNGALPAPVLGPCSVLIQSSITNGIFSATIKQTPVNVAPSPSLVQASGRAALLVVETSTNMQTWQPITNAPFPRSESHRFFRTRLEVSP